MSALNELSERFAYSTKHVDGKPVVQSFGIIVQGGVCRPGLVFCGKQVRHKTLELKIYEPGDDNAPVYLGAVTVRLSNQLRPCAEGTMHTDLEWEVLEKYVGG